MIVDAVKQDFTVCKGEDWSIVFDILDEDGAVLTLTNATVECKIREEASQTSTVIFDFAAVEAIPISASHEITLTLPKASTSTIKQSEGIYEVALTCDEFNGERHYVMDGTFYFESKAT